VLRSFRKFTPLFLLSFVLLQCVLLCACSQPSLIALTHVTAVDPATSAVNPDFTVIVNQAQIAAFGPTASTQIPENAKIIDATGKFLIPGLVDMHVHLLGAGEPTGSRGFILPLLVANGITTVRDMGGDVKFLQQIRKEIATGRRLGPQIFFTGPYLDGDPPYFQPSIVVRNEAETSNAVKLLKSEGVDFIKVQSRLLPGPYFAIARAAREYGMRYVGHVPDSISAAAASDAGQASIEHLTGILLACSDREDELRSRQLAPSRIGNSAVQSSEQMRKWQRDLLDSYSQQKAARLFQKFLVNHTAQTPTLPLLVHLAYLTPETDMANDSRLKYIPAGLRRGWDQGRRAAFANQSEPDFELRRQLAAKSLSLVKQMHDAGIPIMAGTDSTAPNVFPGFGLHEDLYLMVKAGLTPMQALQTATSVPAQFLNRATQQGSIAPGQRADLVLLDASPLNDISNTEKISAVMLNGKYLDRSDLDKLLGDVERFAATH
jgi:hypothetical protein